MLTQEFPQNEQGTIVSYQASLKEFDGLFVLTSESESHRVTKYTFFEEGGITARTVYASCGRSCCHVRNIEFHREGNVIYLRYNGEICLKAVMNGSGPGCCGFSGVN